MPASATNRSLIIDWPLTTVTGWGIFGLNLTLQMLRLGEVDPVLLMPPDSAELLPLHRAVLRETLAGQQYLQRLLDENPGTILDTDFPMLRGLNHTFLPHELSQRLRARRDVGVIFFEDTAIAPDALARARSFNTIVACSTWNYEVLRERGLTNVVMVPQGIDPTLFHPAPRADLFEDRFVVFSGGKLEYRKGQDIVVAAFRAFHARHPEALLLTAWHNHWRQTMVGIDAMGHVRGVPEVDADGHVEVTAWLAANGVPSSAVIDLGAVENHQMPRILREADLAIFPNRCEGGTNLVAMECLACGIPTVLSANTGHLDLVGDESGYALRDQRPVRGGCPLYGGYEGWGESSVEETVEAMEAAYRDRDDARCRGATAARIMHDGWTWASRADELLDALARAGTWPA